MKENMETLKGMLEARQVTIYFLAIVAGAVLDSS